MRHDRHFVDELTQRMGEGIGRMVSVESVTSNQDQPRATLGDMDDLVSSIGKHGILEPLLVRKKGSDGYELISGERRFHAALEAGLREVPCIELEVEDDLALEIALVENLQRKDLSPFEEADGFQTLIKKYGYTHEQVAEAVGRSRVTVTETLKLLVIPDEIRGQCRHADIHAKGMLLEIAKAPSTEAMADLVREIVEGRLDRAALRELRHEMEEAGKPEESSEERGKTSAPRVKPFVLKFRNPDRRFSIALSFKTEREPETKEVIAALEQMIEELRQQQRQHK
jgi:ParB family chromosome partitioning protein